MTHFRPLRKEEEGLQNHLERLGYDNMKWRRLVGDNPSKPINTVAEIARKMGIVRGTVYIWLKLDILEHDKAVESLNDV